MGQMDISPIVQTHLGLVFERCKISKMHMENNHVPAEQKNLDMCQLALKLGYYSV